MKRSDALNIIQEQINKCSGKDWVIVADKILYALEGIGMLPPQRNADQKSSYGYAQVFTWENEDQPPAKGAE